MTAYLTTEQKMLGNKIMRRIVSLSKKAKKLEANGVEGVYSDPEGGVIHIEGSLSWSQGDWRCQTGQCIAGWAPVVARDGTEWLTGIASYSSMRSFVVLGPGLVIPEDFELSVYPYEKQTLGEVLDHIGEAQWANEDILPEYLTDSVDRSRLVVHVSDYARWKLGLTDRDADALFSGSNGLDDVLERWANIKKGVNPYYGTDDDEEE